MRFLAWVFRQLASLRTDRAGQRHPGSAARRAVVAWKDSSGREVSQRVLLQSDDDGKPRAFVRRPLPGSFAQVRETGSSYLVEILSTVPVFGGFELRLGYLGAGRRREERASTNGPALLEADGLGVMKVEVINVSPGGIQLFSVRPASVGAAVRVSGTEAQHLGTVRYCSEAPDGYRIGL